MRYLSAKAIVLASILSSSAISCTATSAALDFTEWNALESLTVSSASVPYVEEFEFGAPPVFYNRYYGDFGTSLSAWKDTTTDTSWLVAGAYTENGTGVAYVFSRPSETAPWHQEARLVAADAAADDYFGEAVSIEGTTVVVGASGHGNGAVYTFDRQASGVWQQADEMSITGVSQYGVSLALTDGTLAVGAPYSDDGHVFMYRRSPVGSGWNILGSLSPPDHPTQAQFGSSLSIDGGRILVGASTDGTVAPNRGSAYLFHFDGSWLFDRKLASYPDGGSGDYFGSSVVLRGNAALIGAPGRNSSAGAIDIFMQDGAGNWNEQAPLQAPDAQSGDRFGYFLSLSGSTLAVGAPGRSAFAGAIYVLSGSGASWTSISTLTAQQTSWLGKAVALIDSDILAGQPYARIDREGRGRIDDFLDSSGAWTFKQSIAASADDTELFAYSVALTSDTALMTAPDRISGDGSSGAIEIYHRGTNDGWVWQAELPSIVSDTSGALALQGDTAVVGARSQNFGTHVYQGAAYVFQRLRSPSGDSWVQQAVLADLAGATNDGMGTAVSIDADTVAVGTPRFNGSSGLVYVYTRSGSTWSLQAKLSPKESAAEDEFGVALALHGNLLAVGAPGCDSYAGAAYIFERSGSTWTEKKRLTAGDRAASDQFGSAIAISDREVVVAAQRKKVGSTLDAGRVYLFSDTGWGTATPLDSPHPDSNQYFGTAIALERNRLAIGEPGSESTYLYSRDSTGWVLQSAVSGKASSYFGQSIAVSGSMVLVGAPYEGSAHASGRAYLLLDDRIFADGYQ